MTEKQWTVEIERLIASKCFSKKSKIRVGAFKRLPYGYEITGYEGHEPESSVIEYETDLLLYESVANGSWIPRVVIEVKLKSINTHDAITYSQKAATHKAVHPYLRYGVILGDRHRYPLPGRLYRHGSNFDFMFSFAGLKPSNREVERFRKLVQDEVAASRALEKIVYESRKPGRDRYTLLQRRLVLE